MAEYIDKAELMEQYPEFDGYIFGDVTTIDIVTCLECKHQVQHKLYQEVLIDNWCEIHWKTITEQNWFCADGERKEW